MRDRTVGKTTEHESQIDLRLRNLAHDLGADARIGTRVSLLKKEGFSKKNIDTIRAEVSDLDVYVLSVPGGVDIKVAANDAISLRDQTGKAVVFLFNDIALIATPKETAKSLVELYNTLDEEKTKAYLTPERIAREKKEEKKEEAFISRMEVAYKKLPPFLKNWVDNCDQNYGRTIDIGIAKDAYLVANALKTVSAINAWEKLSTEEQDRQVAGITTNSGFAFSQVIELAKDYIRELQKHK